MAENRSATPSLNGLIYQRYYYIMCILEFWDEIKEIIEEKYEDFSFLTKENKYILYQIKHIPNSKHESLTKSTSEKGDVSKSGLFKVIDDNWKREKIVEKINHVVCRNKFSKIKEKWFDKERWNDLGKFFLMVKSEIGECNVSSKTQDINNEFNKEYDKIKKYYFNKDDVDCFKFFEDEKLCKKYFEKFKLIESEEKRNDVIDKINQLIEKKFSDFFIKEQNDEYNLIKKNIIFFEIYFYIDEISFENTEKRNIKIFDLNERIKLIIRNFTNPDDLIEEYVKIINKRLENDVTYKYICHNFGELLNKLQSGKQKRYLIWKVCKKLNSMRSNKNGDKKAECRILSTIIAVKLYQIFEEKSLEIRELSIYYPEMIDHIHQITRSHGCPRIRHKNKYLDILFGECPEIKSKKFIKEDEEEL